MTDAQQQPRLGPDPDKPDEPYTIEPQLPTDEDGERMYPEDAPRRGDGIEADGSISGYIGQNEGAVTPTM